MGDGSGGAGGGPVVGGWSVGGPVVGGGPVVDGVVGSVLDVTGGAVVAVGCAATVVVVGCVRVGGRSTRARGLTARADVGSGTCGWSRSRRSGDGVGAGDRATSGGCDDVGRTTTGGSGAGGAAVRTLTNVW